MNKKILVIEGSPRKGGNSDVLCGAFMRGAMEAGHVSEKIFLQDLNISGCRACYKCREDGKCAQKDDMEDILPKLIAADVIVLATPVYFYSLSGQMKTFIDRTLPCYTQIRNKDFYFVATAAARSSMIERTMDALEGFTDCLPGAKIKGKIYGEGLYKSGEAVGSNAEEIAFQMGRNA